jgi:uncharacterized protein (TIGR03663 family)
VTRLRFSLGGAVLLAAAAVTRFADLGSRVLHHDEAVHAWMAHQISRGAGYHYDPVYHGPLLYHLEALVFDLAGSGDFQARLVPAVFGVGLIGLLFYLLKPYCGRATALTAALLAIVSPSLTYYSRFDSHDALIVAFTVVMVTAPFSYRRTGLVWFAGAAALAIATKMNAYFVLGTLVLYATCRTVYGRVRDRRLSVFDFCRRNLEYVGIAAGCAALLLVLLSITTAIYYTRAMDGSILRGIVRTLGAMSLDGFRYWWAAHHIARLGGPFHFYLPILFIYEPLIFLGVPAALVFYMQRRRWFGAALLAVLGMEWILVYHVAAVRSLFAPASGLRGWHLLLASSWLLAGGWAVISLWNARREFLACWVFVGVCQFLLYSYVNEKVPWLVVHILLPWIVVVASCLVDASRAVRSLPVRGVLVALVIVVEAFTARASWIVNTRNRSNLAEPLLQLDYADAVADVATQMTSLAASSGGRLIVSIEPFAQWPFGWYFRGLRVEYPPGPTAPDSSADVLITEDNVLPPALADRFTRSRLPYSHWTRWIEQMDRGDVPGLLRFTFRHDRWGREEGTWFVVWIRKGVPLRFSDP